MKAHVNQHFKFDQIDFEEASFEKVSEYEFICYYKGEKYRIELTGFDIREKSFDVFVNGYSFAVKLEDQLDEIVSRIRQIANKESGGNEITAPIPGLIKEVFVSEGEYLEKDKPVLLLEAMKMENVISAPENGTIREIGVEKGENVKKGSLLFVMEAT
ncbi:acetyl-CoA carboxylase biotin carboxyl carrier protein subunit [Membranihabitans maritimus]|uniref:acetyl-CoA carboxylase biotin carboxyl carrier protein subunit n=1 Tax=Membranihabitans maritimus TaxID=2904244 RepID=UPI001F447C14|nr:acetyl-CoA carboxylase biotin carboxyl carrier protein subunit [Membranihabitans maritimus]